MLSEEQVESILEKVDGNGNEFPGMTYEQGIRDAVEVILENEDLDEFLSQFEVVDDDLN